MNKDLKKGILLKINDTLDTLQLRLTLNKETIILQEQVDPTLKEAVEFYQNIALQNEQAKKVIKECEETIEKLQLLKNHFADLSLDAIVNLYHNYEAFTMATFQQKLMNTLQLTHRL